MQVQPEDAAAAAAAPAAVLQPQLPVQVPVLMHTFVGWCCVHAQLLIGNGYCASAGADASRCTLRCSDQVMVTSYLQVCTQHEQSVDQYFA
jgi:hypothetical protein